LFIYFIGKHFSCSVVYSSQYSLGFISVTRSTDGVKFDAAKFTQQSLQYLHQFSSNFAVF